MWVGIEAGMDALRAGCDLLARPKALFVLTDGVTQLPPNGFIPSLKAYQDKHPDLAFQLNTFGFGYNLDSQLLMDLAVEGNGTCAFIPDALIVGTVFVNTLANVMSTRAQNAKLHLMAEGGAEFTGDVMGRYLVTEAPWGKVVNLGSLGFGQSRDIVVPMRIPAGSRPYLEAVLEYPNTEDLKSEGLRVPCISGERRSNEDARFAAARAQAISIGYQCLDDAGRNNMASANTTMARLVESMQRSVDAGELGPNGQALLDDVSGRMTKSLDGRDRFNRWGKHYLRAIIRAHQVQLCTNFMDPGLQAYGGELFAELRDAGTDVFTGLPPPTPSRAPQRSYGGGAAPAAAAPDMSQYMQGGGGG